MSQREQVLQVAQRELGVQEHPVGSNWGPRIRDYLLSVGITSPAPWCMAFVFFVFREALGKLNPLPHTGYTPDAFNWAKKNQRLIPNGEAQRGDLVLFYFPRMGRIGHVGILGWIGGPSFLRFMYTIEGNTNNDGSREGFQVCRKYRRVLAVHHFVRTI